MESQRLTQKQRKKWSPRALYIFNHSNPFSVLNSIHPTNMKMVSLKFWFLLFIVFVSFSDSEARSSPPVLNKSSQGLMMQTTKQVLEASIKRQVGVRFESKRVSPGGPDPHHH